jgi:hypothetical protein
VVLTVWWLQVIGCVALYLGDLSDEPLYSWRAIVRPKATSGPWNPLASFRSSGIPEIKVHLALRTGGANVHCRRRSSLMLMEPSKHGEVSELQPEQNLNRPKPLSTQVCSQLISEEHLGPTEDPITCTRDSLAGASDIWERFEWARKDSDTDPGPADSGIKTTTEQAVSKSFRQEHSDRERAAAEGTNPAALPGSEFLSPGEFLSFRQSSNHLRDSETFQPGRRLSPVLDASEGQPDQSEEEKPGKAANPQAGRSGSASGTGPDIVSDPQMVLPGALVEQPKLSGACLMI